MLRIRKAREKDLERLWEIINQPGVIEYMPLKRPVPMSRVKKWYDSFVMFNRPTIFVLDVGKVIGACTIRDNGRMTLWIDEDYWGKGHGKRAVAYLKKYAKSKGIDRLWLNCMKENKNALAFYGSLGFGGTEEKGKEVIMELPI